MEVLYQIHLTYRFSSLEHLRQTKKKGAYLIQPHFTEEETLRFVKGFLFCLFVCFYP